MGFVVTAGKTLYTFPATNWNSFWKKPVLHMLVPSAEYTIILTAFSLKTMIPFGATLIESILVTKDSISRTALRTTITATTTKPSHHHIIIMQRIFMTRDSISRTVYHHRDRDRRQHTIVMHRTFKKKSKGSIRRMALGATVTTFHHHRDHHRRQHTIVMHHTPMTRDSISHLLELPVGRMGIWKITNGLY